MYKQSNEAKLAYQSAERTLDIVVNVNGVDYKATDIEQFDYDSGGYTGDTFSIGSTYENNITVKFIHLVEGLKRGMIVKPRIGIKLPSGTFEYTPLGVFIIADEIQMDRNNNSTTIKAYDKFVVMEGQYVSKLTYPANAVDIITEIAQMCKVDVNTDDLAHLPTIKVSKAITKQSYRTAIGWIAQLYVGFASFDRNGKLTIRRVAEPNYTIEPSEYEQQGLVKNEAPYIIGGISCNVNVVETTNNGETNETTHKLHSGSVNGSQIELTNDIMTQSLLDSIWDSLKSITFYPFSLNWFGNPAIEAGDWLSLKDMKGNVFIVPNNGYTISFNGGLSSTSKADQNATDSGTVKYTGELTRAIENYSRRQAPGGTNIYTDVKEPTDAKFNDVWFKPNGNSTELWIFERQADGSGKWVKQPVNGEVEQKINDALKEFDELDKSFKDNANAQSSTNELMKSRIDSISNQIPNLSDEISRVNGNVTSLKTQTDRDRQQLQTTSQNLDQARQDVLSNSNRIDKLTVDLDSVNINVNNVNSKVDNIKIGGTNLVRNSGNPKVTDGWAIGGMSNDRELIVWSHSFWKNAQENLFSLFNRDSNEVYMCSNRVNVERNTNYTLSYWAFEDWRVVSSDTYFLGRKNGETSDFTKITQLVTDRVYSSEKAEYVTVTFNTGEIDEGYIRFDNNGSKEVGKDAVLFLANIKLEKGTITTDWSPAPEDEIERVSQLKVDLNGINATVATNKGDIAQIKLTENGMQQSIKDAQGNISTLQNDSKQFKQQFQNINGSIATITNTANSLSSQLSTKVGTSEYNSFKNQTAQELRTKLTSSDLNGYAKSADVKVSVDGLNARFDNLNVGGTNLIRNSAHDPSNLDHWTTNNVGRVLYSTHSHFRNGTTKMFFLDNKSNQEMILQTEYIDIEPDTDYTLSMVVFGASGVSSGDVFYNIKYKDGSNALFNVDNKFKYNISNAERKVYKFHTSPNSSGSPATQVFIRIDNNGIITGYSNGTSMLGDVKLEKGTIATDWSPSPEDMTDKIEVVSGKVTANSNEFSTVYAKITNAKNDAINAIKGDSQWQSMGKIVTNASFLQNANGFAQEVVRTATPMIEGGGINLLRNSGNSKNIDGWTIGGISNDRKLIVGSHPFWKNNQENLFLLINRSTNGGEATFSSDRIKVERNANYTLSYWAFEDSYVPNSDTYFLGRKTGETSDFTVIKQLVRERKYSGSHAEHVAVTFNTGESDEGYIRFDNNGNTGTQSALYIANIKLERGTVPTDWSPAPEDLATKLQLNQVIDTADSHTRTITDYLTGSNSRFVQMANYLNMNVGNSSVSVNGNGVMLEGNRIKITGKTLIDDAVILDALIKDINANTIKTKTLDASKINVTNLNANNITSGTISGTNLNINLDSGNVSFQSGHIHDSNNYVDINIDQKYISTSDNLGRLLFKGSSLQIAGYNIFDETDDYYLKISNGLAGGSYRGANIVGRDYIAIANKANYLGDYLNMRIDFSGLAAGKSNTGWQPTLVGGADRGVLIAGGNAFSSNYAIGSSPFIAVGTNNDGPSTLGAREWYGKNIVINGEYTYIPSSYNKTTSSASNVFVDSNGILMRSTSASKYKSDISRTHDMDYGNKLLELPIATWIDKAEFERYAKKESEQPPIRHFGMIAEDLADVGLEMLVTRNESGDLEGIQYDRIAPALIPVIADLKRRLENLERKQQANE
ncbi:hypothetical protein [Ligilactobacillus salivarius]|uniref:hypothetical protein n=1 Tax=Ligilactobacillus salivarius TaxID=1624 RepID=UPI002B488998|nr:hypothetical protein [Ligilactobacillus salivarius]